MKNTFFVCSLFSAFFYFSSCSSDGPVSDSGVSEERQLLVEAIDSLEKTMFGQKNMELDKGIAVKEIGLYQDFVKKFPDDSLSPEFLFRSSDLSRAMGDNVKAIEFLSQVSKKYPKYKKIPECLFLQGYYFQEFFGDTVQAKGFYTKLISAYPTHPFADDAKALMQMFGKSEADIIKGFEKNQAEKKN